MARHTEISQLSSPAQRQVTIPHDGIRLDAYHFRRDRVPRRSLREMSHNHSHPSLGKSTPMAPPLYQASVYSLADLDSLDAILNDGEPGFIYARDAHPNAEQLASELKAVEAGDWAVVCGSGMAAISACVLTHAAQGDHIVASDRLYGRTTMLFTDELTRLGIETTYVDCTDLTAVEKALGIKPRLFVAETSSNPLLRMSDIPALAKVAHDRGCPLLVDNTFATPVLCKPLLFGADLVMESLGKLIGGHSDITLGVVCGKGGNPQRMMKAATTWGLMAGPFDCWLAVRSLPTLDLRVRQSSSNAAALADWLPSQPGVRRVIYPGRVDHPDHEIAKRILADGFGNMLCFELTEGRAAVNRFFRSAKAIPFSPSLGHTTTTASHPSCTSHRYLSGAEKARQGITDGLIRLSVGIENLSQMKAEIRRGLT